MSKFWKTLFGGLHGLESRGLSILVTKNRANSLVGYAFGDWWR